MMLKEILFKILIHFSIDKKIPLLEVFKFDPDQPAPTSTPIPEEDDQIKFSIPNTSGIIDLRTPEICPIESSRQKRSPR